MGLQEDTIVKVGTHPKAETDTHPKVETDTHPKVETVFVYQTGFVSSYGEVDTPRALSLFYTSV